MNLQMKVFAGVLLSFAVFIFLLYKFWNRSLDNLHDLYPCENKTAFRCLPQRLAANYYPPVPAFIPPLAEPAAVMKDKVSSYDITVLVKSRPLNLVKRKAIRSTWGSVSSFKEKTLCVIFIVGIGQTQETEAELQNEVRTYGDVLQINVEETFENLPKKSLSTFHWIHKHQPPLSKFYIMTDDDCVINIANTVEFLLENSSSLERSIHCGHMFERNAGVIRGHGKRSISEKIYPYSKYPDFCRGGMVLLSHSYIEKIYQAATVTNLTGFHLEDVLLYGILREKLGITDSIKNVINGGLPLVFYPWDDTDVAVSKMIMKWKEWKADMDSSKKTTWKSGESAVLSDGQLDPK